MPQTLAEMAASVSDEEKAEIARLEELYREVTEGCQCSAGPNDGLAGWGRCLCPKCATKADRLRIGAREAEKRQRTTWHSRRLERPARMEANGRDRDD